MLVVMLGIRFREMYLVINAWGAVVGALGPVSVIIGVVLCVYVGVLLWAMF